VGASSPPPHRTADSGNKKMSRTGPLASDRNGTGDTEDASTPASREKRKRGFPEPVTVLTFVLVLVWIAAVYIPSGQYQLDASGSPIPGSFRDVAPALDLNGRIRDLLLAPVNGMYGIQDANTGQVGLLNNGKCSAPLMSFYSYSRSAAS
jgi:hypothetical protein